MDHLPNISSGGRCRIRCHFKREKTLPTHCHIHIKALLHSWKQMKPIWNIWSGWLWKKFLVRSSWMTCNYWHFLPPHCHLDTHRPSTPPSTTLHTSASPRVSHPPLPPACTWNRVHSPLWSYTWLNCLTVHPASYRHLSNVKSAFSKLDAGRLPGFDCSPVRRRWSGRLLPFHCLLN